MIQHTFSNGETVHLFGTKEVMEILKVASDETVRRRAKQCNVKGIKLRGVTAYTESDVHKMANYVHAKVRPQPLTDETPDGFVTAFEAAHMCGIETMAFVRRASTLGIKSTKGKYTIAQVREYLARYPEFVAKQRALPHRGVAFNAGPGQVQAIFNSEVVYEEQEWPVPVCIEEVEYKAVYLRRADASPPKEGIGYEVDRRAMKPCAML